MGLMEGEGFPNKNQRQAYTFVKEIAMFILFGYNFLGATMEPYRVPLGPHGVP